MFYKYIYAFTLLGVLFSVDFLCQYAVPKSDNKISSWHQECAGMDCLDVYFTGVTFSLNDEFISMLRERYLIPPPKEPNRTKVNIYTPVWRELLDWTKVQESLIDVFKDQPPGFFVEVGAFDGEFLSQTLFLERNLDWTGLLIEPNPRSFVEMVKKKRNSWLSPICVHFNKPSSMNLWRRKIKENLPEHIKQVIISASKLTRELNNGDDKRGSSISVPCTPLTFILKAINITELDLLVVSAGGQNDELKIQDIVKSQTINTKLVLAYYSLDRVHSEPFPLLNGYIRDIKRSLRLMKLYVKRSECVLILSNLPCDEGVVKARWSFSPGLSRTPILYKYFENCLCNSEGIK